MKNDSNNFHDSRAKSSGQVSVKSIVGSVLTCFVLLGLTAYGVYYNIKAEKAESRLRNQYARTFEDMSDYVGNAEKYLLKALAASTPGTVSRMLEETSKCSAQAESCLASLPIEQHLTEKISGYLVQLGDIADCWNHRAIDGGTLTEEEYKTLSELYGYAQDLSGIMNTLGGELSKNSYEWAKFTPATLDTLSNPFTNYPELSYDGPFSAHMLKIEPKNLSGYIMTEAECREKAIKYFADICNCSPDEITAKQSHECSQKNIETYCFSLSCSEKWDAHLDITKKGGKLYSMMISRPHESGNLTPEQGIESGRSFLKSIGLDNMTATFYSFDENAVTASYSYEKDGVIYYPDTVNVKIALDNGSPIAFESHAYILSHSTDKSRIGKASISEEDAREILSNHLTVQKAKEVVVPDNYGGEYHAYEFSCSTFGHPVLVYVDAETGVERDILLVMENEDGIMTA